MILSMLLPRRCLNIVNMPEIRNEYISRPHFENHIYMWTVYMLSNIWKSHEGLLLLLSSTKPFNKVGASLSSLFVWLTLPSIICISIKSAAHQTFISHCSIPPSCRSRTYRESAELYSYLKCSTESLRYSKVVHFICAWWDEKVSQFPWCMAQQTDRG
jgi:hypothetical protein